MSLVGSACIGLLAFLEVPDYSGVCFADQEQGYCVDQITGLEGVFNTASFITMALHLCENPKHPLLTNEYVFASPLGKSVLNRHAKWANG